jgi:endonuclease/exonuclease/phosphatase family metal-dependent hydrolase
MMRIMSFNIRCGNCDEGANSWQQRKELVLQRVRVFAPDLLGMQECRDDAQAEFLKARLPEYQFYGVRRGGGGVTDVETAPIFLLKSSFQIVQTGRFWLSQTPRKAGSKGWDAVFARTAVWAHLRHRASGRTLTFLNTHFDYQPEAIVESARLLRQWSVETLRRHAVILTGDFNADKRSNAYRELTADGLLGDVHRLAQPDGPDEPTFHGFGNPADLAPIDWMLASRHFEVQSASVDTYQQDGRYPSDHFPILAEVEWSPA